MSNRFCGRLWRAALGLTVTLSTGAAWTCHAADPARVISDSQVVPAGRTVAEEDSDAWMYRGMTVVEAGTSTMAARREAAAAIPLQQLTEEARAKAQHVLNSTGLYRHLPTISFEADPDVYSYFLHHPDVAVSTWRALQISRFQLSETSPGRYTADAGDGSVGQVEVFYRTPQDTLIYCDGAFKSPLVPRPIAARALMRVQTRFDRTPDGKVVATHHGDVFVEFPSQTVETIARLISPVSHSIADKNFKQLTLFVQMMSQAMARHPEWVERLAERMDGVSEQSKSQMCEVGSLATQRRLHLATPGDSQVPLEQILTPLQAAPKVAVEPVSARKIR